MAGGAHPSPQPRCGGALRTVSAWGGWWRRGAQQVSWCRLDQRLDAAAQGRCPGGLVGAAELHGALQLHGALHQARRRNGRRLLLGGRVLSLLAPRRDGALGLPQHSVVQRCLAL